MIAGMHRRFKFRDLEFWAENGMICIVDYRKSPPEYKTDSLREFLLRAQQRIDERNRLQARIRASGGSSGNRVLAEQVRELQNCIEAMVQCTRIAKHQGDPHDPRVQEDIAKHGVPGRRIILPSAAQVTEYNKPRPLTELQPRRGRAGLPLVLPDRASDYTGK